MQACPMCGKDKAENSPQCICGYVFTSPSIGEEPLPPPALGADILGRARYFLFLGWLVLASGIVTTVTSFFKTTSVDVSVPYADALPGGLSQTRSIINSGLQQDQMLLFLSGITLSLIGTLFIASGEIATTIVKTKTLPSPET